MVGHVPTLLGARSEERGPSLYRGLLNRGSSLVADWGSVSTKGDKVKNQI